MKNGKRYETLIQDIGLLVFLVSVFCGALVLYMGGYALIAENIVMLFLTALATILITFSAELAAFVVAGTQITGYTAYKLFNLYNSGTAIKPLSFVWLILPVAAAGAMKIFCMGRNKLEQENSLLKQQIEELVMIDPLTGLYNLRSFYYDIDRQIRYTRRNKLPLTLMLVQLKYGQELKKILSKVNYDRLLQRFAEIVGEAIRVEDSQYSIDKDSTLAIILTCDEKGGELVKNRIRSMLGEKGAFDRIADSSIKVEVRIAYVQYSEDMGNDTIYFKNCVEKELQYDV